MDFLLITSTMMSWGVSLALVLALYAGGVWVLGRVAGRAAAPRVPGGALVVDLATARPLALVLHALLSCRWRGRAPGGGGQLPSVATEAAVVLDASAVASYAALVGAPAGSGGVTPPCYLQALAEVVAMVALAGSRAMPLLPLPVHVAQTIDCITPVPRGATVHLNGRLSASRRTHRGTEVDYTSVGCVGGELAFCGTITGLYRGGGGGVGDAPPPPPARLPEPPSSFEPGVAGEFVLSAQEGRAYAAVSGDYNPLHLWPLAGRLLGQPGAIAHGMDVLARVLAAVEAARRLPPPPWRAEARFRRPVVLPARVVLLLRGDGAGGLAFSVRRGSDRETEHLVGTIRPL